MAYITTPELRERLPLEAKGITDPEIDDAIASGVEFVVLRTGDMQGASAMLRDAVAKRAYADVWEIIFGRDVRATETTAVVLRKQADVLVTSYLEWKKDVDEDPLTSNVDTAYIQKVPW
jgi:hypothetical protein